MWFQFSPRQLPGRERRVESLLRRSDFLVAALFGLTTVLNIGDLVTTSLDLSAGLSEANGFVEWLGSAANIGLFDSLVVLKVIFVSGCGFVALLGVGARSERRRRTATLALVAYSALLSFVFLNNLYWLLAT